MGLYSRALAPSVHIHVSIISFSTASLLRRSRRRPRLNARFLFPFQNVKSRSPPSPHSVSFFLRLLRRRLYCCSLWLGCLVRVSFVRLSALLSFFQSQYCVCACSSHSLYVSTVGLYDETLTVLLVQLC